MKNKTEEAQAIDETLANIGESSLSTVPKETALTTPGGFRGVNIEGFEAIPASMVAVPYCRLVQPSSKNTTLADGSEATAGHFLFNDIQETTPQLDFCLLRAKHEMKWVNKDGNFVTPEAEDKDHQKAVVSILGITLDTDKLFVLSLSATSFTAFGKLLAKFKALKVTQSFTYRIVASTCKTENKKGKFYVIDFTLEDKLEADEVTKMSTIACEYGVVLDRQIESDE